MNIQSVVVCVLTSLTLSLGVESRIDAAERSGDDSAWQAGFGKVVITPPNPMWMSGYAGRDRPAEGKVHDLYARAAAIRDSTGKTVLFVALDLIGVPVEMAKALSSEMKRRHDLDRADIMFACSHTHCGPALDHKLSYMLAMDDADWEQVRSYQQRLNGQVQEVMETALGDLQPAQLSTARGTCRFAANRRQPIGLGPIDHDVPILQIADEEGSVRGVIFGYACHNTTLSFYRWCGDYAGFAELYLEDRYPGAVALFFTGCGADQNPLPRRKLELAEKYGRMLGVAVEQGLKNGLQSVRGRLGTAFEEIPLAFEALPAQESLRQTLQSESRFERARAGLLLDELKRHGELSPSYPYPVQVWRVGSGVTWVALGGEVVVDYSLRLKRELGEEATWVTGYANDVMAYIPSERVLQEGGYEGGGSMLYYQQPSRWKSGLEEQIVSTVREMCSRLGTPPP